MEKHRSGLFDQGGGRTRLERARKLASMRRRDGRGAMSIFSPPNMFVLLILLMSVIACSATIILGGHDAGEEGGDTSGQYILEAEASTTTSTTTTTSSTTTTSTSTTTTIETTTTTSTTTTSTTTSTTTTTSTSTTVPCGGDLQPPCEEGDPNGEDGCDEGNVLGADEICHMLTCAPSVESGQRGCGAFALRFCQPGSAYSAKMQGAVKGSVIDERFSEGNE